MTKDELIAVLRLQKIPNIGDVTAKKLIAHCGSPTSVFSDKREHLLSIDGIGSWALQELYNTSFLKAAEAECEYIEKHGISYHSFDDDSYPENLRHCADGPLLLFSRGKIDLERPRIISVVGTRSSTVQGEAFCESLIEELAPLDPIIVSGFAYGIDICAQRAALANNLQTIGCLAHGLNRMYPHEHTPYVREIEKNGGFFTEFWSTTMPNREHFLRRNRIIAGMSEATLVIESAERGGSLVTADIANSYNREVFAVPGRPYDAMSLGCNNLIKQQKAHLLTSAADLVYLLGWELEDVPNKPIQKKLFVELDAQEQCIYSYLQHDGRQQLDTIALKCKIPISRTSSTLLNMEMKGVVRPLPGKCFEAI